MKNFVSFVKDNFNVISQYASIAGLVFTLIYSFLTSDPVVALLALSAIVGLCGFTNFSLARLVSASNKEREDSARLLEDANRELGRKDQQIELTQTKLTTVALIMHNLSDEVNNFARRLENLDDSEPLDLARFRGEAESFLLFSVTNIKEIFDVLTGTACSVTIKLVLGGAHEAESPDKIYVKTLFRDPVSYTSRKKVDAELPTYQVYQNTAFRVIMDPKDTLGERRPRMWGSRAPRVASR